MSSPSSPPPPSPGVVILSSARTPIGSLGGTLSHLSATALGGIAIAAALSRTSLPSSAISACHMGQVLSCGSGQSPARQAATAGGLPPSAVTTSVNKVCASSMAAIFVGCMELSTRRRAALVVGGMESASQCPFFVREMRAGRRLGHVSLVDGIVSDGLSEPDGTHMGVHAELCAATHAFDRHAQDAFARESYTRGAAATAAGVFATEIVPIAARDGSVIAADEELSRTAVGSLAGQAPAFQKDGAGTVTAGNSSPLNDGAAALVLASAAYAAAHGLAVAAEVVGLGDFEGAPGEFTTAPSRAIAVALAHAGLGVGDVDVWEINESFSVVALANMKILRLPPERVNVYGGAVALGHPMGASGARIVCTLINALTRRGGGVGVAAICNGGGGASALVIRVPKSGA